MGIGSFPGTHPAEERSLSRRVSHVPAPSASDRIPASALGRTSGDGALLPEPSGDGARLPLPVPAPPARPPASATPSSARIANLDLLRAAAILLVLADNAVGGGMVDVGEAGNRILTTGWVGVDLFFVLSGWLVGGLYWRELKTFGSVGLGRFWTRRWLRTIPPYLVAFAVVTAGRAVIGKDLQPEMWGRYLTFTQNYLVPPPYWAVSWSLAVEEHFYLFLPLVLGLALRFRRGVPVALGGLALASLVARVVTVPDGAWPWGLQYTATHMRLEGLVLGVLAAYVYHRHTVLWPTVRRVAAWALVPGLVFVASVPWLPADVVNRFAYTGVDLAFLALLVTVVHRRPLPLASSRAVGFVALTSYSVYMTHLTVFGLVERSPAAALPASLYVAVALAAVFAGGAVFYALVEKPSLWLRRRVAPRRSGERSPALPG